MILGKKIKKAFTLAEMIVTVGVIGLIASLAIPALTITTNNRSYAAGFKRAELMLKNATIQLMAENGGNMTNLVPNDAGPEFRDKYCTKLNCIKKCDGNIITNGCFATTKTLMNKTSGVGPLNNAWGAVLSNGMTMATNWYSHNCTQATYRNSANQAVGCFSGGGIFIDINGLKSPNQLGRDVFLFIIHQNGIAPCGVMGTRYQTDDTVWANTCNTSMANGFWAEGFNGIGCAGKILVENGMFY